MIRTVAFSLILTVLLGGCGYHLGEIRPTPMRSVRTLAVPTFKNRTYEPRVEVLLANALIRQLQMDGTYKIVSDESADAVLYCTLNRAERRSIRSVVTNVLATSEFELILEAAFEVQDRVTGEILLSGTAKGKTTFFPTGDIQTDERQAISVAASRLGVSITSRVAEGW